MISFRRVNKIYDSGVAAVKDFCLDIADKEFIVIVGASGSGKTTVLRMLAGLEEISSGQISVNGRVFNNLPPKERGVAMVFQRYALFPHLSVHQNIAIGSKAIGLTKTVADSRIKEVAEFLGISDLLKRRPNSLSGGQRQRVALARAIVREPQIFLLDEPLSNLDAKLRTEMRAEIIKIKRKMQATFIYVTHDQTEAMTMADRIVVMHEGRIMQIGTPAEIYNAPQNLLVASFIGSPQMNLFPAALLPYDITSKPSCDMVGIRPEDIHLVGSASYEAELDSIRIYSCIDFIEETGSDSILHSFLTENNVNRADTPIPNNQNEPRIKLAIKTRSGHGLKMGDAIECAVSLNKIHLFDSITGRRIDG